MTDLPVAVDFETEAIVGNPVLHPPRPVGVAIYRIDHVPTYEPISDDTIAELHHLWEHCELVFHNAPFDLRVAEEHLNIPFPHWSKIHDTALLCYLADPYAKTLALKPSAERYLEIPPTEQDNLRDWILANVHGATEKNFGAFICEAPFEIVSPYAQADVVDTLGLFQHLHPKTQLEGYDRERQLMPILVGATRRGVRTAGPMLEQVLTTHTPAFEQVDQQIRAYLHAPALNVGSGTQLAQALADNDAVTGWDYTPKGARKTAKDSLLKYIKDPELLHRLRYRATLKTILGTFVGPWLGMIENGRLHPDWHQTRGDHIGGTRTGRMSCSNPNFQNPPNVFDIVIPEGMPPLPNMREFILPEEGHIWLKRDFCAQEIRIMAHFEEGALAQAFRDDPNLDPHTMVMNEIHNVTGVLYPRKYVKETGFGMLYGMGVPGLAARLGITEAEARQLIYAYKKALPGVQHMQDGTKARGQSGKPIRTWGGRLVYVEPPKIIKNAYRSFEYKLLNYLIQGSAADQTKQCIIDWDDGNDEAVFMAAVHDEMNISAPEEDWERHMAYLADTMEQDLFDVPMLTDGFYGPNWGTLTEEEEDG